MKRRSIEVSGLHHGGAPVPQACVVGNLLASSRISPLDPDTGDVPAGVDAQVELAFANLLRVLQAAGGGPGDVIRCTLYLPDSSIRPIVDAHWVRMFPDESSRPSRHTLNVELRAGLHIQLDVLAVLGG